MRLVDRNDIENWAERFDSKGNLPILITRLIRATTPNGTFVDFKSGSASFVGGVDGLVNCREETSYVPEGTSLWELGTEADKKGKADKEYEKRTNGSSEHDISQSTFIFVTPRYWRDKEKWRQSKIKDKKWKDIRVYDSAIIEQWLDIAAAVGRWFSGYVPKYPSDGIITIEEFWKEWALGPPGELPPEIVTAGRETESTQLLNFLNNAPNIAGVRATSKDEAIAFIIASTKQFEQKDQERFCSKSLIIDTSSNFRSIRINTKALNLIARFDEPQVLFAAAADGHHVLAALGPDDSFNQEVILLPDTPREGQILALKKMGLTDEDAEKYSKEAARNITFLKRLLKFPQNRLEWLNPESVREIIPAMLVGRWDEKKHGDIRLIEQISGESYSEYSVTLNKWKNIAESPIIQIGETWRLTSPLDAWANLSQFLQKRDTESLRDSFMAAFKDGNPLAEPSNESEKLLFAFNKEKTYSTWIREGLTQSLILIGLYGENLKIGGIPNPQTWVDAIIQSLLYQASGDLWVACNHELPLLAEASPDSFIEAVYESLNYDSSNIMDMFIETDSFIHKSSHHTGLLWALEGLAWMPEYLEDVCLILSKLAKRDPGGNLSNRPFNSLVEILKPWHYQTLADYEQRISTLKSLAAKEPQIAWNLSIKLLPHFHGIAHPTHKMRWRTFGKNFNLQRTYEEIWNTHSSLVDFLLSLFDGSDQKLSDLLDKSVDLAPGDRDKILDFALLHASVVVTQEYLSWQELRKILGHHRSHPDTGWALKENTLKKYEEIFYLLEPKETIARNIWLFNDNWPEFPEGNKFETNSDFTSQEEKINTRRNDAAKAILAEYGLGRLIGLSKEVKEPWRLGYSAGEITDDGILVNVITEINFEDPKELRFIQGFLLNKSLNKPMDWVYQLYEALLQVGFENRKLAQVFIPLSASEEFWTLIENTNEEIRREYWLNIQPWLYNASVQEKKIAISRLLEYDRFYTVIDAISSFPDEISSEQMIEALVSAATKKAAEQIFFKDYEIGRLFQALDNRSDVDRQTLIYLEWLYMPILSGYGTDRSPKNLHDELSSNPQFFVEVLKWLYMPKNKNLLSAERKGIADEVLKNRAEQAYELLNSWKKIPGVNERNEIDSDYLNNWITAVRSLANEVDRIEVADVQIGQLLAQFPEKDQPWPPQPISQIIEHINTESLKTNFSSAVFNNRGSSVRGPFDGGAIEKNHAKYFSELYSYHKGKHPQLATIFNNLAKRYLEQAKIMDDAAARDRLDY